MRPEFPARPLQGNWGFQTACSPPAKRVMAYSPWRALQGRDSLFRCASTGFGNQAWDPTYPSVTGKRRNPLKRTRGLRSASWIA